MKLLRWLSAELGVPRWLWYICVFDGVMTGINWVLPRLSATFGHLRWVP